MWTVSSFTIDYNSELMILSFTTKNNELVIKSKIIFSIRFNYHCHIDWRHIGLFIFLMHHEIT